MSFKQLTLRAGAWKAAVSPDFGANLIGLSYENDPILRSPTREEDLRQKDRCLYGNPLLFPPNRVKDGIFCFEGQEYRLPVNEPQRGNHLHGLFIDAPFQVMEHTETELSCIYQNRGERFPFPFTIFFYYTISERGLLIKINICNDGEKPMPLAMGFHTTFTEPQSFSVPLGKRWERDERLLPTGRLIGLNEREKRMTMGFCPKGSALTGYYTASGHWAEIGGFRMETSGQFDQWVLFNGGGDQGYLCIEPQIGCVNGLNLPKGCRVVGAGQTESCWLRFLKSGLNGSHGKSRSAGEKETVGAG